MRNEKGYVSPIDLDIKMEGFSNIGSSYMKELYYTHYLQGNE
jgi:hypothetical protein